MIRLFNTLGRNMQEFRSHRGKEVTVFTCGPSVYQRSHIGNFRTFLFEDILVRYLAYSGFTVRRGMNFTDIEDKAIREAAKRKTTVRRLTEGNIREFMREMKRLKMKTPDYLPRASDHVDDAVSIIRTLLERDIAYWHRGNVYYDPLKFPGFGQLYGLDMSRWPSQKRRFHKDTYPGVQWNRGDFILWHGYREGDSCYWDTAIGKGRPSWNVQDPSMISQYFHETLSMYCGGMDNLFRHHDYTKAILESVRPYPMAKFWLHGDHLLVNGQKMSKSRGNVVYTDALLKRGYRMADIRFFLVYGHYREKLNYSEERMSSAAGTLMGLRRMVKRIQQSSRNTETAGRFGQMLRRAFADQMNNDLHVRGAVDQLLSILNAILLNPLDPAEAGGIIRTLREIDEVLQVIF